MSAVFDRTSFGRREAEPYWWTENWTAEQKQSDGDPKNRVGHMQRTKARIDADLRKDPDNVFGPEVAR
jgi:hypothetical protein